MTRDLESEPLKIEKMRTNPLEENLRFFVKLNSAEVRNAYLDVLGAAFPAEHAALIKEVARRVALGQINLTLTARCRHCGKYHDEGKLC